MHWVKLMSYVYALMRLVIRFQDLSPKADKWVRKQVQEIRTWLPGKIRKIATVDVVIAVAKAIYEWAREGGKPKPKKKR